MHRDTGVTAALAEWICKFDWEDVPPSVQASVNRSFINWFGCALGGSQDPVVSQCTAAWAGLSHEQHVNIIGRSEKTDVLGAAFLQAISSNILDFDDTHLTTGIHPTGPIASALMAWAGHQLVSGAEFQHALLLGMEVACRIGFAVSPKHYEEGWHITSTCGVFGAAAAVGRLMKLSPLQMSWALGHAATQSSGLVANLGTMAKSVNIGHAAKNGILAAVLARNNVTANAHILEGAHGFSQVMGQQSPMLTVLHRLGEHWETESNTLKPYPCGFVTHPVIDACLALVDTRTISPEEIVGIELVVHPIAKLRAHRPHPQDGLEAKLSLEHAVAVSIQYHRAGLSEFTDAVVHRPEIVGLRQRVLIVTNELQSAKEATVTIKCSDGCQHTHAISNLPEDKNHHMTDLKLAEKFKQLALYGAPHGAAGKWLEYAQDLARLDDVSIFHEMTSP